MVNLLDELRGGHAVARCVHGSRINPSGTAASAARVADDGHDEGFVRCPFARALDSEQPLAAETALGALWDERKVPGARFDLGADFRVRVSSCA